MKILLLTVHYSAKGGIETYVQTMVRAIEERHGSGSVHVLSVVEGPIAGDRPSLPSKMRFALRFGARVATTRYDLIFTGHPFLAPLPYLWKLMTGQPYLTFAYGWEVWTGLSYWRRRAIQASRRVVTISRFTRERLVAACGIDPSIIRILAPAVPMKMLEEFPPRDRVERLKERHGLSQGKIILTLARHAASENYKGCDVVIRALRLLVDRLPDVKYVIAGGGSGLPGLRALAGQQGVTDRVVFLGPVADDDLPGLYDLCDVFIMPSRREGFGIVYLEALARGKPVIAADAGGAPDALLGGRLGLLVDPDRDDMVAQALERVLSGRIGNRLLDRENLRGGVIKHFGFQKFVEALAGIVADTAERGGTLSAEESVEAI